MRTASFLRAFAVASACVLIGCESPFEPKATGIEIAPVVPLRSLGQSVALRAAVLDQRGDTMPNVVVRWASANSSIVSITPDGLATAMANGTATITAVAGDAQGATAVTVAQLVLRLVPTSISLRALGDTGRLLVVARDAGGNPVPVAATWTSLDTAIATVTADGLARAIDNGLARMRVSAGGMDSAATVFVDQLVTTFTLAPASAALEVDDTVALTATVLDATGNPVRNKPVIWSSADSTIATVTSSGLVRVIGRRIDSVRVAARVGALVRTSVIDPSVEFTSIAAADALTCAITTRGLRFCWGTDSPWGQLGVNFAVWSGVADAKVPVRDPAAGPLAFVNSGGWASCGISSVGRMYCWGTGPVGDGTPNPSGVAVEVGGGHVWRMVSATSDVKCGVRTDLVAMCWGNSYEGSLGDGDTTETDRMLPVPVLSGERFTTVSSAGGHSCAIAVNGSPFCWGRRLSGEVGDGQLTFQAARAPTLVAGGHLAQSISAGGERSCMVTTGKALLCWGIGRSGQLGTGDSSAHATPVSVALGVQFDSVSVGDSHTCAVAIDGAAWCWGLNSSGQLGDGTTAYRLTPMAVVGGLRFRSITVGGKHTCGISSAGVAYCWGSNADGELGTNGPSGTVTAVERAPARVRGTRPPESP